MKINQVCVVCLKEGKVGADIKQLVDVTSSRVYPLRCAYGHETLVYLSEFKFQILFEVGLNAIKDGYYREAVSSFTAALERFYEHFIKTVLFRKDGSEQLAKCWKLVSNQSERQLGAFIFLYLSEVGELPEVLSSDDSGFRNRVIHKGEIPTKAQALEFGQTIANLIVPKFAHLLDNYWDESCDMLFSEDQEIRKEDMGKPSSSRNITAFLSTKNQAETVEDYVSRL
ncbi:hypothetical protein DA096_08935 [Vibrio rotiferianus]|uniref:hypothetical protein n=1 Tax=Vibrio rotiferianus TaxID=190895 RepID=UPI00110FFDA0|nr:hypothetical protein [Vibrio rotiferianus]TMX32021.1 hypothetical protein DA095_21455 [Vibrio rotiferianus]TMX55265.1 hypothetical protein DA093_08255 [Vibrio rotiferianus]TMX66207.1 hypothetical protein DA096_08935 [Vibrio rotiferianus]